MNQMAIDMVRSGARHRGGGAARPPRVLMELRPCFDGYAGIPQETRLLFAALVRSPNFEIGGLLNGSSSMRASPRRSARLPEGQEMFAQSARLIALDSGARIVPLARRLARRLLPRQLMMRLEAIERRGAVEPLDTLLDPELFEDWLWMRLFRLGLSPQERLLLRQARYPIPQMAWHEAARLADSRKPGRRVRLDMAKAGWDIHIAHTPSPYVPQGGKLVVRYHDAIPMLWPHTINHAIEHARGHYRMLAGNVADGAWFVCTSDPVREDLLRMFPSVERRTFTIPTMSSPVFRPDLRPPAEIRSIISRGRTAAAGRLRPGGDAGPAPGDAQDGGQGPGQAAEPADEPFIMAVSTLEPRKNYGLLMRAAAAARRGGARFRLVIVANPGWRSEDEVRLLTQLVAEGVVHHLIDVSSVDLRALYTAAHAVVCASRAEGFDLATVEAMACGAPVLASDIPVHRWVCGNAAEYFDPYDEDGLSALIAELVAQPRDHGRLGELRGRALRRSLAYRQPVLESRWEQALQVVAAS